MLEWHKADISDVVLELGTDVKVGRTNMDSDRKRSGDNVIFHTPKVDSKSIVRQIASDASLILMGATYVVAAMIGFHEEAFVAIPLLITFFMLSYYISFLSEKRIAESYKALLPAAKIIENGKRLRLSASEVEIGDLIYFSKGDIIPADARLVTSSELYLAERFFNERSGKVEFKRYKKDHSVIYAEDIVSASYDNMVYASSMVVSGSGSAIVTAIGADTRVERIHKGLTLVPENDRPVYLRAFNRFAKKFSLAVLFSLIPISLALIFVTATSGASGEQINILYSFLVMLAVAVTSMTELIASPSASIVSYTLFKGKKQRISEVTKLSSADALAETDAVLFLCPDVLKDNRKFVRRVFFSEKEYKFDSLKSAELNSLAATLSYFYKYHRVGVEDHEIKAIRRFCADKSLQNVVLGFTSSPKLLRNFPHEGAISCVLSVEDDYPSEYVSKSSDLGILSGCEFFRTDGGSTWRFDSDSRQKVAERYMEYLELGLNVYIFVSKSEGDDSPVFEGIVAIGEEYTFSNGEIFHEYAKNNIKSVLVLESETPETIRFAANCGIADNPDDIILASALEQAGVSLSDIAIESGVYIGFGREGTAEIVQSLRKNHRVLPIIKDSSDRSAISPLTVYATHSEKSFDSIKIASSLSLLPPDSDDRSGGAADVLRCINRSVLARTKLDCFKKYLIFSTVFRISLAVFSMMALKPMNALMMLLSGLLCDLSAMFVTTTVDATQCNAPKNANSRLMSSVVYSAGGIVVSLFAFIFLNILVKAGSVTNAGVPIFTFYLSAICQMLALGASLITIRKRSSNCKFNIAYVVFLTIFVVYLIIQHWLPTSSFVAFQALSFSQVKLSVLSWLLIPATISFVILLLADKISSSFTDQ